MNFNKLGSSSTDLLFHFFVLFEAKLIFLVFIGTSTILRVFLLLSIFFNFILSLQKEFISTLYFYLDKLLLISEAINEECGLGIIRLLRDAFYLDSLRSPKGS